MRGTLPMTSRQDHPLPSVPRRNTRPPPRYYTNTSPLLRPLEPYNVPPPASSSTDNRGIGFSVADLLDHAKFSESSGSSEGDAARPPATVAAGHLVFPRVAAYIPRAILNNSPCCELVQPLNSIS